MLLPFYMFPKVSEKHCDLWAALSCSISSEENVGWIFTVGRVVGPGERGSIFLRLRATFYSHCLYFSLRQRA